MTRFEELKAAAMAELDAACEAADDACVDAWEEAWVAYQAKLKKIQEENSND